MTVSEDMRDNSIVVLIKVRGKIYAKGFGFNPDKQGDLKRAIRLTSHAMTLTADQKIQGAK